MIFSFKWSSYLWFLKKFTSGLEKSKLWLTTLIYPLVHLILLRGKFTEQIFQLTALSKKHDTILGSHHNCNYIWSNSPKIKLLGLIPSVATSIDYTEDVGELYKRLASCVIVYRIQVVENSVPHDKRPNTLVEASKACDQDVFPNLCALLVIACTLPVTTLRDATANWSFSKHVWSTTEQRLSALAMIKVHCRVVEKLNFNKLVIDFANQYPRIMTLPCVFSDSRTWCY